MDLRNLSDDQLHIAACSVAENEREATIKVLKHLVEIERRHLFSKFSCDSLHAYCVKYLKMSEPQAGRRVSASRLLNELPVIEEKVRAGTMNLSTVCQGNTYFRREARAGNKIVREEKLELLNQLEGQSVEKVDTILLSKTDQPEILMRESVKRRTETLTEIKILVDSDTLNNLNRLKEIRSHALPNATFAQIIAELAKIGLEKLDRELNAQRAMGRRAQAAASSVENMMSQRSTLLKSPKLDESPKDQTDLKQMATGRLLISTTPMSESEAENIEPKFEPTATAPASEPVGSPTQPRRPFKTPTSESTRSRYIPSTVRHAVWMRDGGHCTFVDPKNGERCGSRRLVEYDHVHPFAQGGEQTVEKLRLRCRAHNQRHTIETLGAQRAGQWRQSILLNTRTH